MSQKTLASLITCLTIFVLLWQTNFINDLLLFLILGVIPGTNHSVSPSGLIMFYSVIAWLVLFRFEAMRRLRKHLMTTLWQSCLTVRQLSKRHLSQS